MLKNSYNRLSIKNSEIKRRIYLREYIYSGRLTYYIGFTFSVILPRLPYLVRDPATPPNIRLG